MVVAQNRASSIVAYNGKSLAFSAIRRAVNKLVRVIMFARIVAKVGQHVVLIISIVMAALHAFGTWPNKRFQDKLVNIASRSLTVVTQMRDQIATSRQRIQAQQAAFPYRPNASVVTDKIERLKSLNRLPLFCVRVWGRQGANLSSRFANWLGAASDAIVCCSV